ncbi:MAG: glycosyltransferase family 4 protein [Clostridia bacterium]|nr:glycosyltransferase family 4 protein [Clostridia bacterium]
MKRLALIMNSLRFGGAEVQTIELVNNLAKRDYEIVVFCLDSNTEIMKRISDNVEVVVLRKKFTIDPIAISQIVSRLRKFKPDSMILVNSYSMAYGYLVRFFLQRVPKMITIQHTTILISRFEEMKMVIYKRMMNCMDSVIFVCNNQKEYWVNKYSIDPQISQVIYNGIDLERFIGYQSDVGELRKSLGFSPKDIVIGINACLRPEKKHEDMIDALGMLVNAGYPVKLLFIGDGVRREFIEEYMKSKDLEDKVVITGFVQDVRPYLSCVDISALTSTAVETLSMAILESMAMGKTVVLSDIGGASELVDTGENGLLYKAGDVAELFRAIKYIIDNNLFNSMGIKSREKARMLFGKDVMVGRYIDVLKG